ncbi:hypothetical protein ACFQV8_23975 [Pseudonocardia benzenivorans]
MTPALLDAGRAGDVAAARAALDAGADLPAAPTGRSSWRRGRAVLIDPSSRG